MKNHIEHKIIRVMNQSLENCNKCKDYNIRGGNFISHNTNKLDIFFIAQNPGFGNWNSNKKPEEIIPFALQEENNKYHQFFDIFREKFLNKYNREPIFYITNIVKCVTYENALNDPIMIETCIKKYLFDELRYFRKYNQVLNVITLGSAARTNTISMRISEILNLYHPGFLNRKGLERVVQEVNKLMEHIDGKVCN